MADPQRDALLVAVHADVVSESVQTQIPNRRRGEIVAWPIVGPVMNDLTPADVGDNNCWRNRHQRATAGKTEAELTTLIDTVDPRRFRPLVLETVKAYNAKQKPWTPPPARSPVPEERVQERKGELLRQHDRKVAERLVDQRALTELLVDAVTEGVKHAPPVVWRPAPEILIPATAVEEIPVALLGDVHVGTLVDPEEMGGLGEYNFEILKRRLNTYQTRIAQAIDLHRCGAKIRRMLVYMLGDMVEGEVIFDGQAFRIELITVDQLFEGATYIMGWLQGLLATGLVEHIYVACIYGNHGRTTQKKGASKTHSNWDYVMYRHMQAVLAHESRISWFIPKAWFAIVDVMGWRIYGTHGEVIKSWMGIPFYAVQRHDMRTTTLLQSVDIDYRYWVCGDKHVSATIPRVTGAQIMNGSTVGGSDFSMHILGTASEPMQTLFGINEILGKTWQYDMVLDKRDPEEIRKHLALTRI